MANDTAMWVSFFVSAGIEAELAGTYAVTFAEHRIRGDMLRELTRQHLRDMGILPVGDSIAILRHAKFVVESAARDRLLHQPAPIAASAASAATPVTRMLEHYTGASPRKRKPEWSEEPRESRRARAESPSAAVAQPGGTVWARLGASEGALPYAGVLKRAEPAELSERKPPVKCVKFSDRVHTQEIPTATIFNKPERRLARDPSSGAATCVKDRLAPLPSTPASARLAMDATSNPSVKARLAPAQPTVKARLAPAQPTVKARLALAQPTVKARLAPAQPAVNSRLAPARLSAPGSPTTKVIESRWTSKTLQINKDVKSRLETGRNLRSCRATDSLLLTKSRLVSITAPDDKDMRSRLSSRANKPARLPHPSDGVKSRLGAVRDSAANNIRLTKSIFTRLGV